MMAYASGNSSLQASSSNLLWRTSQTSYSAGHISKSLGHPCHCGGCSFVSLLDKAFAVEQPKTACMAVIRNRQSR